MSETEIKRLRSEGEAALTKAAALEAASSRWPDLRQYEGRWGKRVNVARSANPLVTDFDSRHNCGCCPDSPLEVWPYLDTPEGRIYSDPTGIFVGERSYQGGDQPFDRWEQRLRTHGIAEAVVAKITEMFRVHAAARAAEDAADDEVAGA